MNETPDTYLADFGLPVVFGSVSGVGILDMPDSIDAGIVINTTYMLTAKTSDFGSLAHGDTGTVGADSYKVNEVRKISDGVFVQIYLEKL